MRCFFVFRYCRIYSADNLQIRAHQLFDAAGVKTDMDGVAVLSNDFAVAESLMIDAFAQIVGRFFTHIAVTTAAVGNAFFIAVVIIFLLVVIRAV